MIQSKSKTFLAFCFSFLIGVSSASFFVFQIPVVWVYVSVFLCVSLGILIWEYRFIRFVFLCAVFVYIGLLRYQFAFPLGEQHVSHLSGEHAVVGVIITEPDIRTDAVRYIVETTSVDEVVSSGRVYVKLPLYPRFAYGDEIALDCLLQVPEPIEKFRYDMYLARYGVFSLCRTQKEVTLISEGNASFFLRTIFRLKARIADKIELLWHEPMAGFMAGLLYGYRGGLGSLNELFARTGVTHIIAISGYNITLIASILMTMCIHLLIPRKKAFWLLSIGIVLFVIFAGASASVVRAGVMGMIVLFAKRLGRNSSILPTMMATAVCMTLINPFILIWDAGFQLSFIATIGLVYLTPIIERPLRRIPELFGMKESLISTLAAIIATLPLILYQFGRLSVVAPIVNMLILWILPWIMMVGFFAVVMSFVFLPLAQYLAWIAWLGMSYIVIIVHYFSDVSFAAVDVSFPLWGMLVGYALLGYLLYRQKKQSVVS
ncbi:ComEC family competence protein [Patescibacteria group bacterium]|nr:ComEC family competence protein [Patescibacteria group bacterium]